MNSGHAIRPLTMAFAFCAALLVFAVFAFPLARQESAMYGYAAATASFLVAIAAALSPGLLRPEHAVMMVIAGVALRMMIVLAMAAIVYLTMRTQFRAFALSLLGYYGVYILAEIAIIIKRYFLKPATEAAHA